MNVIIPMNLLLAPILLLLMDCEAAEAATLKRSSNAVGETVRATVFIRTAWTGDPQCFYRARVVP